MATNWNKPVWEVIVGNVGAVYRGNSGAEAKKVYNTYVRISKAGRGRAGGEGVTLFRDGEPEKEHYGRMENPKQSIAATLKRLLPSSGKKIKVELFRVGNQIKAKIPLASLKRNPALRKNVAAGFVDEEGQFHPIRASHDYSKARGGDKVVRKRKPAKKAAKRKSVRRRAPKKTIAKKRAAKRTVRRRR